MADLIIAEGDSEFHGTCECGKHLGTVRPDESLDKLGEAWDRHVMVLRECPIGSEDPENPRERPEFTLVELRMIYAAFESVATAPVEQDELMPGIRGIAKGIHDKAHELARQKGRIELAAEQAKEKRGG